MLQNFFSADLPVAVRFAAVFVVVVLVIVGLATGSRFLSKPRASEYLQPPPAPVQIAHMVETIEGGGGVGVAALFLVIASVISFIIFLNSSTVLQEISALLIWSGNSIFWGVIMIVAALGRKRTYVVYRDVAPAERQEPRFEKP
jgi:predicted membrane protein